MSCLALTGYSVSENVSVTASAFWLTLARLANQLNWHLHRYTVTLQHVYVIIIHVIYVYMVYLTKMVNSEMSRVMFTFQLLLLFRNWTLCRRLLVRCSLAPTLFIHFWTSTADGTEYLHLSAPNGSLLFSSCIITVGSFSEGHINGTTTANRSYSGSHSGGGWPWRDATQPLQKQACHVTRQSRIPPWAV